MSHRPPPRKRQLTHRGTIRRTLGALGAFGALVTLTVCSDRPRTPTATDRGPGPNAAVAAADPVFVGAGDVASCSNNNDEITAKLLDGIDGTIFVAGDIAYEDGTTAEFNNCYNPTWGRHKARTRPSPGNHEYNSGGGGYYNYFGAAAGPSGRGYYSYNVGTWHVLSLNSNVSGSNTSAQANWVRADLRANPAACTIAYWHHPVFSSGEHGNDSRMATIWRILDSADVDVVLTGHDHNYERFAPQTSTGAASATGIRSFVVGTGGRELRPFSTIRANSQVRNSNTYGVFKMTLHSGSYSWEFIPQPGRTFTDAGSAACVDPAPPPPPGPNTPPVARVGGPYSGNEGASISMSAATSSDADGETLTYAWTFGDGTTGTGATVGKTYADNGSYPVRVIVTDQRGARDTATTTATVANVAPTATFNAPTSASTGSTYTLSLTNATDASSADRTAGFSYAFDCGAGYGAYGSASSITCSAVSTPGTRTVRGRLRDKESAVREYTDNVSITTTPPPPPPPTDAVLIVLDKNAIDKGVSPNNFSESDVNQDRIDYDERSELRYFASRAGSTVTLYSGKVGSEGWYAFRSVPSTWTSAGPTTSGLRNFRLAGPGLGSPNRSGDREALLDKVPNLVPLRATGLEQLVGRTVCGVVMESTASVNYGGTVATAIKGKYRGIVAFTVSSLRRSTVSSDALPIMTVRVVDADAACGATLLTLSSAPSPSSSSSPFDVVP